MSDEPKDDSPDKRWPEDFWPEIEWGDEEEKQRIAKKACTTSSTNDWFAYAEREQVDADFRRKLEAFVSDADFRQELIDMSLAKDRYWELLMKYASRVSLLTPEQILKAERNEWIRNRHGALKRSGMRVGEARAQILKELNGVVLDFEWGTLSDYTMDEIIRAGKESS